MKLAETFKKFPSTFEIKEEPVETFRLRGRLCLLTEEEMIENEKMWIEENLNQNV